MKLNPKTKKEILKVGIAIAIVAAISVAIFFVLRSFGLTDIDKIRDWVSSCGNWSWVVFILIQTAFTVFLCFIPSFSADLVWLGCLLFNDGTVIGMFKTSAICLTSIAISSMVMFFVGRYGGGKLLKWLIGEEDLEKAKKLLSIKAEVYLPLMYMFPLFPDDALSAVAGMTKMRWWHNLLIVVIFRGLGVVAICFLGSDFFHYETFTLAEWFEFISSCVVWLIVCFYLAHKLDEKIEKERKEKDENK